MLQNAPPAPDSGRPAVAASQGAPQILGGTLGTRPVSMHTIRFTGSGSEYFRIWIVNLLLMLLTLGLYYPWAKVRKLRYFYGNTYVIGQPLAFHGEPRKMLRGFLLVSLLMLLYSVAGHVSHMAGGISAAILALIWPALMRASLQFRLSQTSWRGLRFHFAGTLKQAYLVFLSPMLIMFGVSLLAGILTAMLPGRGVGPVVFGGVMVLSVAAVGPYTLWKLKQYQHANYALGQLQTSFRAPYSRVLRIFIKTGALGLLMLLAFGALSGLLSASMFTSLMNAEAGKPTHASAVALIVPFVMGYVLLAQVVQGPYFTSRMQNLLWTETGNRLVRFKSHLEWKPLALLSLRNWILVLATLGLYWPFAAIALARAKLQAVVIHTRQDPDLLVSQVRQGNQDAAGDLAADLIGIDVGL